eukprot:CAMPEP_0113494818 /NCGR_PEP_ID=MMETSP0014_2-20120614/29298_1 /TAXON_ID=2857 /ORGANISM="Nitzschia sp." /LENGTH=203 /DNA_ID=CAMNT_0000388713 /DNA_START=99 /DNA_END=710 /DNA_ORIENTATION=- /assembly_acc=CAM_ASM_000159
MVSKSPSQYSQEEVAIFLNSIGLGSKIDGFKENGVDGALLVTLTEDDLKNDLGMSNLQARKFLQSLDFAKSLSESDGAGGGGGAEVATLKEENEKLKEEIQQLKMVNKDLHEKLAGTSAPPPAPAPKPAPAPAPAPSSYKSSGGGEVIRGAGGGALRGATLGAIGGAIAGDAAQGAKMGAAMGGAAGGMRGMGARRQRRLGRR